LPQGINNEGIVTPASPRPEEEEEEEEATTDRGKLGLVGGAGEGPEPLSTYRRTSSDRGYAFLLHEESSSFFLSGFLRC
jgi:hypothetical protein